MLRLTTSILILSATTAMADLTMRFDEGAPKDRFTLTNTGDCALPAMQVTLDLGSAPAGLIFDVTGSGAGVEVFQPFELVAGAQHLRGTPTVQDGDSAIVLDVVALGAMQSIVFTIDVDDTGGGREITVDGSEIAGAKLHTTIKGQQASAVFSAVASAAVPMESCTS